MVFHAEGLAGIELHYTAQLTVQPFRGIENGGHAFPAAESALPAIDQPPVDVPPSPRYHYFCITAHVASLIAATWPLFRRLHRSACSLAVLHCTSNALPTRHMFNLNNCIPVAVTYIHTYIHTYIRTVSIQHD